MPILVLNKSVYVMKDWCVTVCYYRVTCEFESESTLYSLLECQRAPCPNQGHIWSLSDSNGVRTHNHLIVRKRTLNNLAKLAKCLSRVVSTYLFSAFDCMLLSYHVRVSKLHSIVCLNVKELFAWIKCHIWSLSDSNQIRTHNHSVRKPTLNDLSKWLSCALSTYLYLSRLWVRISLLSLRLMCNFPRKIFGQNLF